MYIKYLLLLLAILPLTILAQNSIVDNNVTEVVQEKLQIIDVDTIVWVTNSNDVIQTDRYNKILQKYIEVTYPQKVLNYKKRVLQQKLKTEKELLKEKKRKERQQKRLNHKINIQKYTNVLNGIMWQDDVDSDILKLDWYQAKEYCEKLDLLSFDNWRIPTTQELQSIVKKESFKYMFFKQYWSSSEYITNSTKKWSVDTNNSSKLVVKKLDKLYVRCVREI